MGIIIIAVILGIIFAGILYIFNEKQHYGKTLTALLFIVRTIVIALLVLLFFNPFIKTKQKHIEPSTIIIAQDNSNSLILTKDSTFYKTVLPSKLDSLIDNIDRNYTIDKYLFGNETKDFDSIDYQDHYTDFNDLLNFIKKNYYKKNVGAVILLSDGICNKSYLPEQDIESFPFPIYTVTLGDTTNYPDLYIKDVFYNKTASSNTIMPIRIVANANNCRNKTMNINILVNNEIIENKTLNISSNKFSNTIDFNINSEEEGVKQIDIQIEAIDKESVINNNNKRIFVEVIDKQYKALFYAKSPHPDLGCIKNILGNHYEIETIFQYDSIPDLKKYDIVFMHQIPFSGMGNFDAIAQQLEKNKKLPIFHIIGESTDINAFNKLQSSIKIDKGAVNSNLDIRAHYNHNFGLFNIKEEVIESINIFPPLSLPHLEFSFIGNHDIILQMKINDVLTQSPLLSFSNDGERKNAFLFGTGIWRWKMYDYYSNDSHDNFEELISKSVQYLLTEKDKELTINHKNSYLNNESIILTADLKNPSQELTNEPDLKIRIVNKHNKQIYEYVFSKKDKSYHLNIQSLPEGIYHFTAESQYGNTTYSESGSFSIVNIGAEAQNLVADHQRMQLIASLTDGKNFSINELNKLTETIFNDKRITSIIREKTDYKDLINMKSLFFVILSLVSIEWILRKIFGSY